MSKSIYLIGYPLNYSWSPAMQQAALLALGIDANYALKEVKPEDLCSAVSAFRHEGVIGFNVTMPFKQAIIPLLDEISIEASSTGAVNTVINLGNSLIGYNTDVCGARHMLSVIGTVDRDIVVFGAGGAARAVLSAMTDKELAPASVILVNRSQQRVMELLAYSQSLGHTTQVCSPDQVHAALERCDMAINCSTDSQWLLGLPLRGQVWDLNYGMKALKLREYCESSGTPYRDGSLMLLGQGAQAFELWTGLPAPVDVMVQSLQAQGAHI